MGVATRRIASHWKRAPRSRPLSQGYEALGIILSHEIPDGSRHVCGNGVSSFGLSRCSGTTTCRRRRKWTTLDQKQRWISSNRTLPPWPFLAPSPPPQNVQSFSYTTTAGEEEAAPGNLFRRIAVLGAGKMAEALVVPLVTLGLQSPEDIVLYDVVPEASQRLAQACQQEDQQTGSIPIAASPAEAVQNAELILLAVKPASVDALCQELASCWSSHATLLSVVAGRTLTSLQEASGGNCPSIVRCMPNTPARVGAGMTVWTATPSVNEDTAQRIQQLLSSVGEAMHVKDEKLIDMSTSISGSGPAFVYAFMEAMTDAGVHVGFSREDATTLVYQTVWGSVTYAMKHRQQQQQPHHIGLLKSEVTSPAGTTAAGLYELERGGFRTAVHDCVWATYRRSVELGTTTTTTPTKPMQMFSRDFSQPLTAGLDF